MNAIAKVKSSHSSPDGIAIKTAIENLSPELLRAYVDAVVGIGVEIRRTLSVAGAEVTCEHCGLFPKPEHGLCDPEALFLVCKEVSSRTVIMPAGLTSDRKGEYLDQSFERPVTLLTSFGAVSLYTSLRYCNEIKDVMKGIRDKMDLELIRPARLHCSPPQGNGNYCYDFPQDPAIYRVKAFNARTLKSGSFFEMRSGEPTLASALLEHTIVGKYIDQLFKMAAEGRQLI